VEIEFTFNEYKLKGAGLIICRKHLETEITVFPADDIFILFEDGTTCDPEGESLKDFF
jgi:hypothetical protein